MTSQRKLKLEWQFDLRLEQNSSSHFKSRQKWPRNNYLAFLPTINLNLLTVTIYFFSNGIRFQIYWNNSNNSFDRKYSAFFKKLWKWGGKFNFQLKEKISSKFCDILPSRWQSYKTLISSFFPNFATKLGHFSVNALFSSVINTQAKQRKAEKIFILRGKKFGRIDSRWQSYKRHFVFIYFLRLEKKSHFSLKINISENMWWKGTK